MKKIYIVFVVLALAIGALFFVSEPASLEVDSDNSFAQVSEELENGAVLLDVRSPAEYNEAHFTAALNHDVELLKSGNFPNYDKDTPLYLYCRSGNRSAQAMKILQEAGYTKIYDLGGLSDMEAIGATYAEI